MLYQFDMGEGKSRYYYGDRSPVYTYHGPNAYYLRHEAPPTPPVLRQWDVEPCANIGIAMDFYAAAIIIKCNGKFGVLLRDKCLGGMGDGGRYGASSFPCVYDDIRLTNPVSGARLFKRSDVLCGFISVCKGGKWANLLLSEEPLGGKVTSKLANQFVFDTAEEAEKWMEENKETVDISFALPSLPECMSTSVRFIAVSDIHNSGMEGIDPAGFDAMLVAGDFLKHPGRYYHAGDRDAINNTPLFKWCNDHPDFPVFLIPGNHDCVVEHSPDWLVWPKNVVRLDTAGGAVEFKGLKIFGTPWTKPHPKHDGVFVAEEKELRAKFNNIPANLDILVTHGPPMLFEGEGGLDYDRQHVSHIGSTALREAILEKKPKLVVCGHAHGGTRDVVHIGASMIINVGRVLGYSTPRFSPAFVVIGFGGTLDVTPAKRL